MVDGNASCAVAAFKHHLFQYAEWGCLWFGDLRALGATWLGCQIFQEALNFMQWGILKTKLHSLNTMNLYFLVKLLKDLWLGMFFFSWMSLNILDLNIGGEGLNVIIWRKFSWKESRMVFNQLV